MDKSKNAISIKALTVKYNEGKEDEVTALNKMDLNVKTGELYGFLGPNGAGKTTAINVLSGLLKPTSGKVLVNGHDVISDLEKVKEIIGVCPQEPSIFPYLSGRKNLEFFGRLYCVPKTELKVRTQKLIEGFKMEDFVERRAKGYSGGMIRKINTAIALISDPQIIFLDEPTVAMDPQSRRAVWAYIRQLQDRGKTIILTTHYMEEADTLSERVGIIDNGEIIEEGSPSELKSKHGVDTLEDVFIKLTGRQLRNGV